MNKKDQCKCGCEKDVRAEMCRTCKYPKKTEKICPGCDEIYPIDEFSFRKNGKYGFCRRPRCKKCEAEYSRQRKLKNPNAASISAQKYAAKNPHKIREWGFRSRWKKMGFNPNEVQNFLLSHQGGCEICGSNEKLVVDHDHNSQKLRGVLCSECNLGIGKFKDDIKLLKMAADYLETQQSTFCPNETIIKHERFII